MIDLTGLQIQIPGQEITAIPGFFMKTKKAPFQGGQENKAFCCRSEKGLLYFSPHISFTTHIRDFSSGIQVQDSQAGPAFTLSGGTGCSVGDILPQVGQVTDFLSGGQALPRPNRIR